MAYSPVGNSMANQLAVGRNVLPSSRLAYVFIPGNAWRQKVRCMQPKWPLGCCTEKEEERQGAERQLAAWAAECTRLGAAVVDVRHAAEDTLVRARAEWRTRAAHLKVVLAGRALSLMIQDFGLVPKPAESSSPRG